MRKQISGGRRSPIKPDPAADAQNVLPKDWLRSHRVITGWVIVVLSFFLFLSPKTHDYSGDTRANCDLAYWLADKGEFNLANHPNYAGQATVGYWVFKDASGHVGPYFPPGTAMFGMIGFRVAMLAGVPLSAANAPIVGKYILSMMMAFAVWCCWYTIIHRAGDYAGLIAAICLSAASPIYSHFVQGFFVQSGTLFSQAFACAALTAALGQSEHRKRFAILCGIAGFFGTYTYFCRPTFLVFAAGFAGFAIFTLGRRSLFFAIGVALALAFGFWLNMKTQLRPLGVYATSHTAENRVTEVALIAKHLVAMCFSPGRGFFLFMPWAVLSTVGIAMMAAKSKGRDGWMLIHVLHACAIFGAVAMHKNWAGGWSHGPRLQSDALISIMFLAAPAFAWLSQRIWGLFITAMLILPAALNQHHAARMPMYHWEPNVSGMIFRTWDWKTADYMWYARRGRQLRELIGETREPIMSGPSVIASSPDAGKHVGYGMVRPENAQFYSIQARDSALYFIPPETLKDRDELLLVVEFLQPVPVHDLYRVRLELNGEEMGTFDYYAANTHPGPRAVRLTPTQLWQQPYDVLSIHFEKWAEDTRSEVFLNVPRFAVIPATAENLKQLENYILNPKSMP